MIDGIEWCSTATIASLDRDVRKEISGDNLGSCGSATKKFNLHDFQKRESIAIKLKPIAELNDMTVTKVRVYNCDWYWAGSSDSYEIALKDDPGMDYSAHCKFGKNHDFTLGEWKDKRWKLHFWVFLTDIILDK